MQIRNLIWIGLVLVGCGQYPNPNDLGSVAPENRVAVAYKRLDSAEATLDYKVQSNEISDERRNDLIKELSATMLEKVDPKVVPAGDQWMYASLLRVTDHWKEAEAALTVAVQSADSPDRKVNDNLKLAQAQAKNGNVVEAIKTASSILNVDNKDAAPILPAVLYEVVPAAENKGHNKDLADLLSKAIECHERVQVDTNSDGGKQFIIARKFHITKAKLKVDELSRSNT